ncbi:uncharacterized protein LOC119672444 [Teleopsis dalmanni]|uniref:uncharacterized protein LOC119667855 n=1 Tax=Teleopsis dalmanni TaxID=139649 RepID=UPI0018CCBBB8|nr:uncharacterized protein LOC119667855 [Teleopsis dalmanni]XP_037939429.1 uncharacterized protein LOC119672444 [Teleopsis dalmanni]
MTCKQYMDYLLIGLVEICHFFETVFSPENCAHYVPLVYSTAFVMGVQLICNRVLGIWLSRCSNSKFGALIVFLIKLWIGFFVSECTFAVLCSYCTNEFIFIPTTDVQKYPTLFGSLLICVVFMCGIYATKPIKEKIIESVKCFINFIKHQNTDPHNLSAIQSIFIRSVKSLHRMCTRSDDNRSDDPSHSETDDSEIDELMTE